jgi:calcineurin-like phosphoesterase family protein
MSPQRKDTAHTFARPLASAPDQLASGTPALENQTFHELPPPTGNPPFRLDLAKVIGRSAAKKIVTKGEIALHTVGDTGGIGNSAPQQIVAMWLERDAATHSTAFLYHLGDVVYYDGEHGQYYPQFYEPYFHYPAPIFAIPGNHDHDVGVPPNHESLEPFMANFCAKTPSVLPDARDVPRTSMTQPNCYWTLRAPLVTIIGLDTNAPEHGVVKPDQAAWLLGELKDAPKDRALIVALHHPPLSADSHHGASKSMRDLLDKAFEDANRLPDVVLSGHIHTYERFTRPLPNGDTLAYVVAGAGGYPHLHTLAHVDGKPPPVPWTDPTTGVTLENYSQHHRHGFLRLTINATQIRGAYTTVPRPQESWSDGPVDVIDEFRIPIKSAP